MDDQNKNLLLATALSFLVLIGWMLLFPPEVPNPNQMENTDITQKNNNLEVPTTSKIAVNENSQAMADNKIGRVQIETSRLSGSIWLRGGRIDDLKLIDYFDDQKPDSKNVVILTPAGENKSYYAAYGWTPVSGLSPADVPNANSKWTLIAGRVLSENSPIKLQWKNNTGLVFQRQISIDENFMFSITQSVINQSNQNIKVAPYGIIARHGKPDTIGSYILHEGVVASKDSELIEQKYKKLPDQPFIQNENGNVTIHSVEQNGWIGFTDKYWMTTLIPSPGQKFRMASKYTPQTDTYQTDMRLPAMEVTPGSERVMTTSFFAGAKEVNTIKNYQKNNDVENFVDSVDLSLIHI